MLHKTLLILIAQLSLSTALSATAPSIKQQIPAKKRTSQGFPAVPDLSPGQYAVFVDDDYLVFQTKKYSGLEMDSSCFKKTGEPHCEAFSFSKFKTPPFDSPHELMNNKAAQNCLALGAKSLIALDHKRREYSFCRFPDRSMISAWSLYFKHNPLTVRQ